MSPPLEDARSPASDPGGHPPGSSPSPGWDRVVEAWPRLDRGLYPLFAGSCVLYAALAFYGSMHRQTHGVWSAPLDDVFIHFDYARATARGYPFEWSEGNGYSSGNTSLTYPFVLALGHLAGFRGLLLMKWAAIVACGATLGFLMAAARLFRPLGRWAKYLLPPGVLALGALDWSLFSGMENAFHLGVWALGLVAALSLARAARRAEPTAPEDLAVDWDADRDARRVRRLGWLTGVAGALLFATRPESVVCVAAFAGFAAFAVRTRFGRRAALATVLRVALPAALTLVAQTAANRLLTGEWAANGAIAKLSLNNPYLTGQEKWDEYVFLLKYVVLRLTQHHFSDALPWGWLVPAVALLPLVHRGTRAAALLLWAQVAGWLVLVAANGQVRWQNERYTMAAVAWLLVLAAMGLAVCASAPRPGRVGRAVWLLRTAVAVGLASAFWVHQAPNMRDQVWFFGRASRNIRDQHVVAGEQLAELDVKRVLVGDAGALIYASDRPGLDLIGLGGYHDLPFARAAVHGLGASLELIERMPASDRPDTMALYPSWWGDLPTLFGQRLTEVPVHGNVICGGAEKVLYRADWSSLDGTGLPRTLRPGERVVDAIDVADLVSEAAHRYVFPHPSMGFVGFRILADASHAPATAAAARVAPGSRPPERLASRARELFDAGRLIPEHQTERARAAAPRGPGRLVVRTATTHPLAVEVRANGRVLGRLDVPVTRGWAEPSLELPAGLPERFELELSPVGGEWTDYHVWIVEGGAASPAAGPE